MLFHFILLLLISLSKKILLIPSGTREHKEITTHKGDFFPVPFQLRKAEKFLFQPYRCFPMAILALGRKHSEPVFFSL